MQERRDRLAPRLPRAARLSLRFVSKGNIMRELTPFECNMVSGMGNVSSGYSSPPALAASAPILQEVEKDCGLSPAQIEAACAPLMFGAALVGGTLSGATAAVLTSNPIIVNDAVVIGAGASSSLVGDICHDYMRNHCHL
jgi:hypothetical protein